MRKNGTGNFYAPDSSGGGKKRGDSFLKGAAVLGAGGVLAKLLGVLYRIPLTNLIGAEGIGVYQMVFPFYTLLLTISGAGLPTAISKMVAERRARGEFQEADRVFSAACKALAVLGLAASLLVALLHRAVAALQGNPGAALAYLGIAPSLFLVALISALRGYFQGRHNMMPTALSQITEQVVKIAAGLGFAYLLLPYGVSYAALGALLGVTVSEAAALLQLFLQYKSYKRKQGRGAGVEPFRGADSGEEDFAALQDYAIRQNAFNFEAGEIAADVDSGRRAAGGGSARAEKAEKAERRKSERELIRSIFKISLPITLGAIILPATQLIDSVLVINLLRRAGCDVRQATVLYGIMTGPVMSIINMPVVLSLAVATSAVPSVAALKGAGAAEKLKGKAREALKIAALISVPAALGVGLLAAPAIRILYGGALNSGAGIDERLIAVQLLSMCAVSIVFIALMQVSTAVLQAAGRPYAPVLSLAAGAAVKIIVTLILVPNPRLHIYGAAAGTVLCYAVAAILDLLELWSVTRGKKEPSLRT